MSKTVNTSQSLCHQIEKDNFLRIEWFKNKPQYRSGGQYEIYRKRILTYAPFSEHEKLPQISADAKKKKNNNDHYSGLSLSKFKIPDMYNIEPSVKALLNSQSTKKGRNKYLKVRSNSLPENRYKYPLLNSWSYGWKLGN
ncbi:hypothetical protein A3Q56_04267 [Intoshia linei]|uniref:Sperm microtubule inner protein 1 C-terminal domain-containing protein n=1 Tax=Intoshia linei TaxID=1819745 RepID=A0A177B175_9BILA|nr:hypothetical protein A3Q56_04267 [Intoshia linei]